MQLSGVNGKVKVLDTIGFNFINNFEPNQAIWRHILAEFKIKPTADVLTSL